MASLFQRPRMRMRSGHRTTGTEGTGSDVVDVNSGMTRDSESGSTQEACNHWRGDSSCAASIIEVYMKEGGRGSVVLDEMGHPSKGGTDWA